MASSLLPRLLSACVVCEPCLYLLLLPLLLKPLLLPFQLLRQLPLLRELCLRHLLHSPLPQLPTHLPPR